MLSPNVIIPFDGLHANIPLGWARDTRFDGKYVKAVASGFGVNGGNATHGHNSPSHTHSYSSNSHTHTTGNIANASNTIKTDAQHQDSPPQDVSTSTHYHPSQTSGAFANGSITSATATVGTASNEFSRYHFIFIKSLGYNFIPTNGLIFRNDTSDRVGATHFDSLDGRYMKGAGTGADAGSATDVASHNHTQTHNHTMTHNHDSVNSGNVSGLLGGKDVSSSSPGNHSHTVSFANYDDVVTNSTAVPSFTNDLAYKELHPWKFATPSIPLVGDIAMTTETVVPIGWEDLGLSDVYVRGKSKGSALSTGGSLTHVHADLSHSHAGSSHAHAWSTSSVGGGNAYRNGGSASIVGDHTHSGTTSSATNASSGTASATFDSSNYEPEFITVRFIRFKFMLGVAPACVSIL